MSASDTISLILFVALGAWWLIAPRSVIRFYTWFHGKHLRVHPKPLGVRIAGFLWIVLVVGIVFFGSRR